ncbi:hypothetical protein QJS10_CPB20g00409 [Acorus calamus]|uniref:Uncharacterized protein n=1 Tax=Acorus calamus TaxID=4465 RepID=A0AAV9CCX2_ACOCL|nr:hypothetical protein QJS10_CPB20g00409 [Acorus calamus]
MDLGRPGLGLCGSPADGSGRRRSGPKQRTRGSTYACVGRRVGWTSAKSAWSKQWARLRTWIRVRVQGDSEVIRRWARFGAR